MDKLFNSFLKMLNCPELKYDIRFLLDDKNNVLIIKIKDKS